MAQSGDARGSPVAQGEAVAEQSTDLEAAGSEIGRVTLVAARALVVSWG